MAVYIFKRLLLAIPTLLIITFLTYCLMRAAPGDPMTIKGGGYLSSGGTPDSMGRKEGENLSDSAKIFRARYHLDRSIPVGYALWLKGILLHGDFGQSITVSMGTPVWELIIERVPPTLKLSLWSMAVIYIIAIPVGIWSAMRRGSRMEKGISVFFFILYSLPSFWLGLMVLLAAKAWFPMWPTSQLEPQNIEGMSYWQILLETSKHYVLPVFCMTYAALAGLSRYARVGLLDVIKQDYIRTARAKGCSEWRTILVHAARNGMIPIIVMMAGLLPGLVGGSIIVEYLFDINGMGLLSITAIGAKDYPLIMTLFSAEALLTLLGILMSDIALSLVDPRISYDRKT